jgi:hypothetical protein
MYGGIGGSWAVSLHRIAEGVNSPCWCGSRGIADTPEELAFFTTSAGFLPVGLIVRGDRTDRTRT